MSSVNRYTSRAARPPVWVLLLLSGLGVAAVGPLLPFLRSGGSGEGLLAACVAGQGVGAYVGARSATALERRHGRGGLALVGVALLLAAFLVLGLIGGGATIAAAAGLGGGATLLLTAAWAHLTDAAGAQRNRALARGELLVSAAGVSVPLALGLVGERLWRVVPLAMALAALAVVARLRLPGGAPGPVDVPSARGRAALGGRVMAIVLCGTAIEWALAFWTASYFDVALGHPADAATALAALLPAAMLAGRGALALLAGRHDPAPLLRIAAATLAVGLVGMLLACSTAVAAPSVLLAGAGVSWIFPLAIATALAREQAPGTSATIAAALGAASLATLIAPAAVGALVALAGLREGLALLLLPLAGLLAATVGSPRAAPDGSGARVSRVPQPATDAS